MNSTGPSPRRLSSSGRHATRRAIVAIVLVGCVLAACGTAARDRSTAGSTDPHGHPAHAAPSFSGAAWVASLEKQDAGKAGYLLPGSDPSVLPGPIIIADRNNNRIMMISPKGQILWQFPTAGQLAPGQTFLSPDDAFFSPSGDQIIMTQEEDFVITVISLPSGHITYRYGHPGVPGSNPGYLDNPDDAMLLPDGDILSADIKNCRLIVLPPGGQSPSRIFGDTTQGCMHDPPARWGSPNGAFPMTNGNYLVTEINGDWVDELSLSGQVLWSTHPPGFTYPSDSNEVSPGVYVSVDYTNPGGLETFNRQGEVLWQYKPTSPAGTLDEPSLAMPLPNGDFLLNDDYNDRVVVIDPRNDQIVWQYGHTGVPGTAPGYLDKPDGVDLAPPNSLLVTHAATMGQPTGTSASASASGPVQSSGQRSALTSASAFPPPGGRREAVVIHG